LNFGELILMKITEISATRWHILKQKCIKFDFGWGSAQDPARGAYRGPYCYGTGKGKGRKEERMEGKGERNGKRET